MLKPFKNSMAVESSKIGKSTNSSRSTMTLFPIYILGMLIRAWFLSGEGKQEHQNGLQRSKKMIDLLEVLSIFKPGAIP
jgi:hypothetical protein